MSEVRTPYDDDLEQHWKVYGNPSRATGAAKELQVGRVLERNGWLRCYEAQRAQREAADALAEAVSDFVLFGSHAPTCMGDGICRCGRQATRDALDAYRKACEVQS